MSDTLESGYRNPRTPLEKKIAELGPWFHNLHLPDGTQTAPQHPLGDFPRFKWEQIAPHIPEDLSGKSVLDLGCNAGFYSFELAGRGATVLGVDLDRRYLKQARWASGIFGLEDKVSFKRMQVYDVVNIEGTFDIVLFMGLFYHLRYPLLALDVVAKKVKDLLIFQTLTMPGDEIMTPPQDIGIHDRDLMRDPGWPKMAFIENRLAGDGTNWWAPNASAVEAMLRSSGFRVSARPGSEIFLCEHVEQPAQ